MEFPPVKWTRRGPLEGIGFPMAGKLGKASSVAEFDANPPAGDKAAEIVIGSIPLPTRCEEARIS